MTYGIPDKAGGRRSRLPRWAVLGATLLTIPVIWLIATTVDVQALETVWEAVAQRPGGLVLALVAFAAAFGLRSFAWTRVLPDLELRHSWSALHVSLGGNHVLPLRLGEPLRVVSVVRRAGIDWPRATASTVTLRAADLLAIGAIGAIAGLGALTAWWATAGIVLLGTVLVTVGVVWLARLRDEGRVSLPGPVAITATLGAWALESVVVYETARWAGVELTFAGAILVTAAAVVSQVAAIAPGGLGTYEAGGVAAMVFLGVDPGVGLAVVLTAHAVKTAYSLVVGLVAVFVPSPGMFGRLRLQDVDASREKRGSPEREGPVVLFMPAFNEASTVGRVVSRVPDSVGEHPVVCLVVDDGSSDDTASLAEAAGADVIRQGKNQGLGAAVRTGLKESLRYQPAAVAFCDADGEYAPEELDVMVRPILEGRADYVVGSRFAGDIERMLPHRRLGNLVLTLLVSWLARRRISDGQSGYRAFSPRAAGSAEIIHDFNYAQVLTLDLLAKGMKYAEVPITYRFRTTGESFVKLGRYLRAVVPAVYRELNAET